MPVDVGHKLGYKNCPRIAGNAVRKQGDTSD